ncbi:hypothetical protein VSDG_05559 [Cytospora chrysosperma]|uniref:Uncharacterized protein n=1 Tax=Cytospora chrysosperma TaxID=252740 RepID=A0A423W018_CYTCH|nr:hypothetical protein VSDG_05559 [Valsa sordida]
MVRAVLPNSHTRYVVTYADLSKYLEEVFGSEFEFNIEYTNDHWHFESPERLTQNDEAMVAKVTDSVSENHALVRRLRRIRDRVSFTSACCLSNLEALRSICKSREGPARDMYNSMLPTAETIINGYIQNSKSLQNGIDNTIELISYTLAVHNQEETAKLDKETRNLAEETSRVTMELKTINESSANDSAIISIITTLSAIYVPGSFVASIFGTNFFQFGAETKQIAITGDFWKFIICWVGLTLVTAAICFLSSLMRGRKGRLSARDRGPSSLWTGTGAEKV